MVGWSRSSRPVAPDRRLDLRQGRLPELVEAADRLLFPLRRTRPKGDADPGWRRIGWDEALDETATALRRIAAESGPEAVAFAVTTSAGTAISDAGPWINRLINAFGSPNNCNANEICAWHRDSATSLTTGAGIGTPTTSGPAASCCGASTRARRGLPRRVRSPTCGRGARLVVVDPRRWARGQGRPMAAGAAGDRWRAGAVDRRCDDRARWHDAPFLRLTNGPFLVRDDTGRLLRADELPPEAPASASSPGTKVAALQRYDPRTRAMTRHRSGSHCSGRSRSRVATVRSPAARRATFSLRSP
jgi:hypothetical protein